MKCQRILLSSSKMAAQQAILQREWCRIT
uniref:Uncharacterized protein n=1 Tax=Rhizophora mucronata TaxID=61149 RepID=A0A2P2QE76_RHIMU